MLNKICKRRKQQANGNEKIIRKLMTIRKLVNLILTPWSVKLLPR